MADQMVLDFKGLLAEQPHGPVTGAKWMQRARATGSRLLDRLDHAEYRAEAAERELAAVRAELDTFRKTLADNECYCLEMAELRDAAIVRAEVAEGELATLRAALTKINDIRNSIVGSQTVNWSEHVYPLVAALDEAGFKGLEYPEARQHVATLIERAEVAEALVGAFREAVGVDPTCPKCHGDGGRWLGLASSCEHWEPCQCWRVSRELATMEAALDITLWEWHGEHERYCRLCSGLYPRHTAACKATRKLAGVEAHLALTQRSVVLAYMTGRLRWGEMMRCLTAEDDAVAQSAVYHRTLAEAEQEARAALAALDKAKEADRG